MKNKFKHSKSGFTIIESLVAISILVVSITAALSAVQSGLSSYIYSKNQISAFYLAQEGFEQIRNMRDENRLKNRDWLYGIAASSNDPCYFGNACIVNPGYSTVPTRCPAVGSCPILRQDTSGWYGYDSAFVPTIFRREVVLTSISSTEIRVTVTVNWNKGMVSKQFVAKENLLNWQ